MTLKNNASQHYSRRDYKVSRYPKRCCSIGKQAKYESKGSYMLIKPEHDRGISHQLVVTWKSNVKKLNKAYHAQTYK